MKQYSSMHKYMLFHVAPYRKDQSLDLSPPARHHASYTTPDHRFLTFQLLFAVASQVFAVWKTALESLWNEESNDINEAT